MTHGRTRPLSVTLLAWLFIGVGAGGILKDVLPLLGPDRTQAAQGLMVEGPFGLALIWSIRLLAVIGGVFMLGGHNWARWLLVAWMCLHVAISLAHSPLETVMHVVIFTGVGLLLFRRPASAYFAAS